MINTSNTSVSQQSHSEVSSSEDGNEVSDKTQKTMNSESTGNASLSHNQYHDGTVSQTSHSGNSIEVTSLIEVAIVRNRSLTNSEKNRLLTTQPDNRILPS